MACRCVYFGLRDAERRYRENRYPPNLPALWAEVEYWKSRREARSCSCSEGAVSAPLGT